MENPPPNYTEYPRPGSNYPRGNFAKPVDPPGYYLEYIGNAFNMIWAKKDVFILGTLVIGLLYYGFSFLESIAVSMIVYGTPLAQPTEIDSKYFVYLGLSMILTGLGIGIYYGCVNGFAAAAIEYMDTGNTSFNTLFSGFKNFAQLMLVGFIIYFATLIGYCLLIIPGVYLTGIFAMAPLICSFENRTAVDSIKESMRRTKEFAWGLFAVVLVSVIVSALGFLGCCIGIVFTAAVMPIVLGMHYRNFREITQPNGNNGGFQIS